MPLKQGKTLLETGATGTEAAILRKRPHAQTRLSAMIADVIITGRNTVSQATFEQLQRLLDEQGARYRVVEHPSAGKSEEVAKIRGTQLGQAPRRWSATSKGMG